MAHFFIDSDGVIANFEEGFKIAFGMEHNSIPEKTMWEMILGKDDYWETLPLMPRAKELVEMLNGLPVSILTGAPKTGYEAARLGKIKFFSQHFPHLNVIVCRSFRKPEFMNDEGDVLVDDLEKNCKRWNAAGGISFQYHPDRFDELRDFLGI